MIQVNRIYLIFNRLVTKKFLVDTSDLVTIHVYCLGIRRFPFEFCHNEFGKNSPFFMHLRDFRS